MSWRRNFGQSLCGMGRAEFVSVRVKDVEYLSCHDQSRGENSPERKRDQIQIAVTDADIGDIGSPCFKGEPQHLVKRVSRAMW
jgi:hypothetical protein